MENILPDFHEFMNFCVRTGGYTFPCETQKGLIQ